MDFEKEYRIEQDRIKHNISLDRMILEKCEKKHQNITSAWGKFMPLQDLLQQLSLLQSEFRQQLRMVKIFTNPTVL